jgi:hypothetical protein
VPVDVEGWEGFWNQNDFLNNIFLNEVRIP